MFINFILRYAGHTVWFGNLYGQSHFSPILVHLSAVVISYVYFMTPRELRPILPVHEICPE